MLVTPGFSHSPAMLLVMSSCSRAGPPPCPGSSEGEGSGPCMKMYVFRADVKIPAQEGSAVSMGDPAPLVGQVLLLSPALISLQPGCYEPQLSPPPAQSWDPQRNRTHPQQQQETPPRKQRERRGVPTEGAAGLGEHFQWPYVGHGAGRGFSHPRTGDRRLIPLPPLPVAGNAGGGRGSSRSSEAPASSSSAPRAI